MQPLPCRIFISVLLSLNTAVATHYATTPQAEAHYHQPPAVSDYLKTLISCQVRRDDNPGRERMLVINALKRATDNVEKTLHITGSNSFYYTYSNRRGGGILTEMIRLRKVLEDQGAQLDSLRKNHAAKLESLEKKVASISQWNATMKPMQEVGISIRQGFFDTVLTSDGKASSKRYRAIRIANKVAHYGDFQTDTLLMKLGYLKNTRAFQDLYGVPYKHAEGYISMYTAMAYIL